MPSFTEVMTRIGASGSVHDLVRREYLSALHEVTGRNVILYYSGWLDKGYLARLGVDAFSIGDSDKNGFMATVHQLDRSLGLDLLLHTPGGDLAATESIVEYLRQMFGTDIRVIVPQLAMSAGTLIALSAKSIVMGKHSSLGPIDPQIFGIPAHGVVEEFRRAVEEVSADPARIPIWQPIIAKYSPTLVGECEKAIKWSEEMAREWLKSGMFKDDPEADQKASSILGELGSHALTLNHARHISAAKAKSLGIVMEELEDDQELQEAVLTVHHACMLTLSATPAVKIIENHRGVASIQSVQVGGVPVPQSAQPVGAEVPWPPAVPSLAE
jgi:Serine dehydrogenase proteinase